jgi:hypothetical protein
MRYVAKDFYECSPYEEAEILCESDSYEECEAACKLRYEDTDGECDLTIKDTVDNCWHDYDYYYNEED